MKFSLSEKYKDNAILRLTFEFSIEAVKYAEKLESKKKFVIARQLLRSATSIGANVKEAQNAESKADFVHKMKIASKEADETEYWLFLCQNIDSYPECESLITKLSGIIKLLNSIIGTSKRNLK
ncbi:MAG: four helix bundle protein [Cytophagaceae bacterium]|nr:four helix bundle protein [Cytophagaceae bacterium]|tara:strand:+ start:6406 stop:6777 length:372 start_codon:yes stop_codon:yes gene_type:complete